MNTNKVDDHENGDGEVHDDRVDEFETFSFDQKDIFVLEFRKDGAWDYETLNRREILEMGQQKCIQVFGASSEMLQLRDVRVLLPDSTSAEPTIIVRKLACLVSLTLVRALVLPDRMIVFVPYGADELIYILSVKMKELFAGIQDSNLTIAPEYATDPAEDEEVLDDDKNVVNESQALIHSKRDREELLSSRRERAELLSKRDRAELMERRLSESRDRSVGSGSFETAMDIESFELLALEGVLWTAIKLLERDYQKLVPEVEHTIRTAKHAITVQSLNLMRQCRERASLLLARAEAEQRALSSLSNNDRDLALLSFDEVLRNPHRYRDSDTDVVDHDNKSNDMMIEAYIQRFDSLILHIRFMLEQVEFAQSNIAVSLDITRNKLLKVENAVNIMTSFAEVGTLVVTIFAMNLNSTIQNLPSAAPFWILFGILFLGFLLGGMLLFYFANRYI